MTRTRTITALTSLLTLLLSGAVAAYGLSQLARVLTAPPVQTPPIAPPQALGPPPQALATAQEPSAPARPWPALFGEPAPPAPPPPEPAPEPEPIPEEPPFPEDDFFLGDVPYTLRGLVDQGDGRGYAIVQTDTGTLLARQGDILPGGETVLEIARDGIEIGFGDDILFLGFDDMADDAGADPADEYEREFGDDPETIEALQGGDQPYGFGPRPFGLGTVGRRTQ